LKIGFEKDYANFVKRVQKKGKKIKYKRGMSDRESDKYEKKMILYSSRAFHKSWNKRKEYRSQFNDNDRTRKRKERKKLDSPYDDVYQ
jgi:hypothetical protein